MPEIAIIHYTAPPKELGGVEIVIENHVRYLSESGYRIRILFGSGGGLDYRNITEHKIPLLWPNHPTIQNIQEDLLSKGESSQFQAVKEMITDELTRNLKGVDVCIVHNIPSMPFNFAATAALNDVSEKVRRMIFWIHDSALLRDEWACRKESFPTTLLHHKAKNITYVTPTNARAKELSRLDEPYKISNAVVVPNGVTIEEFIKIDEVTKLLMKKLGLSFENYIIVIPVRVTPRKNIELALFVVDELKHLIAEPRQIKLLVTGPPDHQASKLGIAYLEYLKEIMERRGLNENVIFCHELIDQKREYRNGAIQKWSVADVYNIADMIFIPSREEGFGLPVIEAGAARKPIFCSRIPPFQELIRDDIEGFMFDLDEDPKSIAFRIYRRYLEDRVDNNFDNVIRRFTWENIIKRKIIPLL
ncbi:glycosyltransferase family 4 protein [Candidatus Bathyarchaeota archaeon]|nr:glycosyltransferase family 4 protein [Candidatus Bathyarchaeota archaeon]